VYERVDSDGFGHAWKGPDGLIWSEKKESPSQYSAIVSCQFKEGGRLPSKLDFEAGEVFGLREALPIDDHEGDWTSTSVPDISYIAYAFGGWDGQFSQVPRDGSGFYRCVKQ
jgi:hypothetical protein